ncbi:hypothetical protein [Prevotella sp. E13-27]|uniref:hypothetical protein n=1 Tax=Prevotella sp. E13-27 TaxID=2938122 RepID=UPI00200B1788|nr:hypothetical protein [Prevotella sp. E13-27]MCK8621979.1 hypothetical protein [Prevotella sp. E13-27]
MKKNYQTPSIYVFAVKSVLMTTSTLPTGETTPDVYVSDKEYNGEFSSRRNSVWDDEEEEAE